MNYRSVADLNADIKKFAVKLPKDFDLIVGIPRSGLLAANLLALYMNLPFTDVDGFCEGRVLSFGLRMGKINNNFKKVLVIDDSLCSGQQMKKNKEIISGKISQYDIYFGAIYVEPSEVKQIDFWHEIVGFPRVFEWNVMNHFLLWDSCVDIDGVLCRDPTPQENDDGVNYREFITNVAPLTIPTQTIGWLVTCRLEKYRSLTEDWLRRFGVQYRNLIMLDLPDKKTRMALKSYGVFKAKVYKSVDALLFIESSQKQAMDIVKLARKPVFCIETNKMICPNIFGKFYNYGIKFIRYADDSPKVALVKTLQFFGRKYAKWARFIFQKTIKSYKIRHN